MGRGVKKVVGVEKGRERERSRGVEVGHEHMKRGGKWNRERMEAGREDQEQERSKRPRGPCILNLIVYRRHDK